MTTLTTTALCAALGALLLTGPAAAQPATAAEAATAQEPLSEDLLEAEGETLDETSPLAALPAGTYEIEKTHAYVTFSYSHLGFSRPVLAFNEVDATADVNPADPAASSLRVTIDPASIDSAVETFDEHLRSADMFDVEQHPEITFVSTGIELASGTTGTMTGELTMKGVTKPVTLDVTLNGAGQHPMTGLDTFGISATGTLDRTEWDLGYAAPAVGEEVELRIEAEFVQARS